MVKQRWNPMGVVSPGSPGLYEEQFSKGLGKYADYCITNTVWFNPKNEITQRVRGGVQEALPEGRVRVPRHQRRLHLRRDPDRRRRVQAREEHRSPRRWPRRSGRPNIPATDRVTLGGPIKFNAKGQVEGNRSRGDPEPEGQADGRRCPRSSPRRSSSSRCPRSGDTPSRREGAQMPALPHLANAVVSGVLTGRSTA